MTHGGTVVTATDRMMQVGLDGSRFFGRISTGFLKLDEHGWLALSGEKGTADFNMAFVARTAPVSLLEEYVGTIRERGLNAIVIVDEEAPELVEAGVALGLDAVGNVPVMEWTSKPRPTPDETFTVRRATKADVPTANTLAAQAFSLDEEMLQRVFLPEILDDGVDVWIVEEEGRALGIGMFIRTGNHVGIYTMSTPPTNQRRGVGRAVLDTAMAYYLDQGVTTFTLEATEAGFHLYEQVGFETVALPTVLLIGESTQFPG